MRANSSKSNISVETKRINGKIKPHKLEKLARESGFQKRESKKISAENFLKGFFLMILSKGNNSFEAWAAKISMLIKQTVSKQAVWLKMTQEEVKFLEAVLSSVMKSAIRLKSGYQVKSAIRLKSEVDKKRSVFGKFKDILLEDSTCQKLTGKLKKYYPGSVNQTGSISILRIDAIYSLKHFIFKHFKLTSFRDVDYKRSIDILDYATRGALVIRDLGYFVLESFKKMIEDGIYFISRIHVQKNIYDRLSGEEIKLLKLLKGRDLLDKWVLMGAKQRLLVRLIAVRLDARIVNQRRRKARLNRKYRYSKEYMKLLDYSFFITNCTDEMLILKEVVELYRMRWRIEIIFKTWKSYLSLGDVIECDNKLRVDSFILSMLIYIVLFVVNLYNCLEQYSNRISLIKFCNYIVSNFLLIIPLWNNASSETYIIQQILYYCCYDKRKRVNFNQQLLALT